MATARLASLAAAFAAACGSGVTNQTIVLDGSTALHRYDGHGALSAGASSRLLWDYPEPQRSDVLDYLFKPKFGAALHTLKVEIGGDAQSTDGTEPSHMHSRHDLSCTRGYELWLIQQAKARNPSILTYGLSWGVPAWVGNGTYYSADNVNYQVGWMHCIKSQSGYALDYMGLWNEKPQPEADYVLQLRQAMNDSGFVDTKIIVMDGGYDAAEVALAQTNPAYASAVYGAGLHYPCDNPQPAVRETGWTFWASEDYSRDPAWPAGGTYWGKVLSQNYVLMNMTATISWSLIWSAYTNLVCNGAGLMRAHEPWSGNYEVSAPIWASAHWTQFVDPGWRFLHVPGGGSGFLTLPNGATGGTYVTLVPPTDLSGLTLIIETLDNNDCIRRNYSDWQLNFKTQGGLAGAGTVLHVWKTVSSAYFVQQADIVIDSTGSFSLFVEADAMYTLSTVAGAQHGTASAPIPASIPWPLPYSDAFNAYPDDAMAKFFSDQGGSWAVRNGTLQQVAPADPGANAWAVNPDPLTQIGDPNWADVQVSVDVTFSPQIAQPAMALSTPGSAQRKASPGRQRVDQWRQGQGLPALEPGTLRAGSAAPFLFPCDGTQPGQVWAWNTPAPGYLRGAGNGQCINIGGCDPTQIIMYECVDDPTGSSCGAPAGQYPNLVWALNASGALTSPEPTSPNWSLTWNATSQSFYMSPLFTGAPEQVWRYNSSSGSLSLPSLGQCLSSTPLQRVYAQVCVRITSFDGFNAQEAMAGYCLQVDQKGGWSLVSAGKILSNGTVVAAVPSTLGASGGVSSAFDPTTSHTLTLTAAGTVITASIDGQQLVQLSDNGYSIGNVAIGSGWHQAAFDNFQVSAPSLV